MHKRVCLAHVPVLVFHSVRRHDLGELGGLSLEEAVFDRQLAALARGGYRSINCAQLCDHLERGAPLPENPVLITFDDGYLDNFTIAGPVLRRRGFKATVFVASDYVDDSIRVREGPAESGYLTAGELRAMELSGVFEVQAHSAAHARLPIRPEVIDFQQPSGAPVWRSGWMGEVRAFVPDGSVEERTTAYVASHGGPEFFARQGWRNELQRVVASVPVVGRFESEDERRARLALDLTRSRTALERILGHDVPFMAWPGGGSSALAIDVALRDAGFRATFGTNRTPDGVVPGVSAIPRTYFNQTYRGRFATTARVWKLRGVADYESGRVGGYARLFAANRLMQIGGATRD